MFACLWDPTGEEVPEGALLALARSFSPRLRRRGAGRIVLDVKGMERLFGGAETLGETLGRAVAERGWSVQIAVAPTCTAAELLALGRAGVTVALGSAALRLLAALPLEVLARWMEGMGPLGASWRCDRLASSRAARLREDTVAGALCTLRRWGIRTLGDLTALPGPEVCARLGVAGLALQRLARGEDLVPFVPEVDADPFETTVELDWPVDRIDALAGVVDRALAPLCARLERAAAGAVRLHLHLRLATRETVTRTLELPAPLRDPRVLGTLLRLEVEASLAGRGGGCRGRTQAAADGRRGAEELPGVEAVTVRLDPAPARVVQGSLLARARPAAERLATLVARLTALVGAGRVGAPGLVDSHRPGAFVVRPFDPPSPDASPDPPRPAPRLRLGLRRLRVPVPARVALVQGRPVDMRLGYPLAGGGRILACAGPWRTSGQWWTSVGGGPCDGEGVAPGWDRDEWDVLASDGGLYRVFRDRVTGRWFVDGLVD
jgi:protein ImuB